MGITFYYGSGSPFSWKAWLALEHKQLSYEMKVLSLQQGEQKSPAYLAINPRGKVPVLIDGDCIIRDSGVIAEYLDERYPNPPLLPSDFAARAHARRIVAEANLYLYPALRRLMDLTLFRSDGPGAPADIAQALDQLKHELSYFEQGLDGDYCVGTLSFADYSLYPMLALIKRLQDKQPQHGAGKLLTPKFQGLMAAIERLPYYAKTIPPHWKG